MTKYVVYSYSSYYNSDGTLCYEAVPGGTYQDAESASLRAFELQSMGYPTEIEIQKEQDIEHDR